MLLAAVGGPKWDTTDPDAPRPEQGLLGLRKALGLYANLRPVRAVDGAAATPARCGARSSRAPTCSSCASSPAASTSARRRARDDSASDQCVYTVEEIERIARIAFGAARSKVTSVDKANVLETSRLWREVVRRVHAEEFPHVELEHALVDYAAMKLITAPRHFDVILTENMFGDILSDEAAVRHRLARAAAQRLARGRRAGPVRARPRLGAGHRRARGSPTRWRCSCRPRCMLRHGLGREARPRP